MIMSQLREVGDKMFRVKGIVCVRVQKLDLVQFIRRFEVIECWENGKEKFRGIDGLECEFYFKDIY